MPEVLQINYLYCELWHGIWSSSNASISWSQGLSRFTAKRIEYAPNFSLILKGLSRLVLENAIAIWSNGSSNVFKTIYN